MTKRLEKKLSRVVKAIESGATFSLVGVSKSTFSLQHAFCSHKKKRDSLLFWQYVVF